MGWFKRKPKNKPKREEKTVRTQMFGKLPLEDFKARLLRFYKQECALEEENSYFEPQDSLFGEMFDNAIRIRFLKEENEELEGQYDDDEIMARAKEEYEKDKKRQPEGGE